jgi:hypothetical protein
MDEASDERYRLFSTEVDSFVDLRSHAKWSTATRVVPYLWNRDYESVAELRVTIRSIETFIEFDDLFANTDAKFNVSPTFTNDKRRVRMDSGLITALARKHGLTNIDYQTRPYYIYSFEHCCNNHDVLYVWSEEWAAGSELFEYEEEIVPVGDVFFDGSDQVDSDEDIVSIFTAETAEDYRLTLEYNLNLIRTCVDIAAEHPEYEFVLKPKYQDQIEQFLSEIEELPENMSVKYEGYGADALVRRSSIVVAIGFTTPGINALMRGKKTIIYSELEHIEGPLSNTRAVCESREAVNDLFEYYASSRDLPDEDREAFDPFRDGQARKRIIQDMMDR